MQVVRESSLEEYVFWYLQRERRKGRPDVIPTEPSQQVRTMRKDHRGKMRSWFDRSTRWQLVKIEAEELANLVFLEDPSTWRRGSLLSTGRTTDCSVESPRMR
jgi:hypothetical protein